MLFYLVYYLMLNTTATPQIFENKCACLSLSILNKFTGKISGKSASVLKKHRTQTLFSFLAYVYDTLSSQHAYRRSLECEIIMCSSKYMKVRISTNPIILAKTRSNKPVQRNLLHTSPKWLFEILPWLHSGEDAKTFFSPYA